MIKKKIDSERRKERNNDEKRKGKNKD